MPTRRGFLKALAALPVLALAARLPAPEQNSVVTPRFDFLPDEGRSFRLKLYVQHSEEGPELQIAEEEWRHFDRVDSLRYAYNSVAARNWDHQIIYHDDGNYIAVFTPQHVGRYLGEFRLRR